MGSGGVTEWRSEPVGVGVGVGGLGISKADGDWDGAEGFLFARDRVFGR
jgi:hypothetical protein